MNTALHATAEIHQNLAGWHMVMSSPACNALSSSHLYICILA